MSFAVSCAGCGLEYSSRRPLRAGRLLREILRFQRSAEEVVARDEHAGSTLARFAVAEGYSERFAQHYLVPLCVRDLVDAARRRARLSRPATRCRSSPTTACSASATSAGAPCAGGSSEYVARAARPAPRSRAPGRACAPSSATPTASRCAPATARRAGSTGSWSPRTRTRRWRCSPRRPPTSGGCSAPSRSPSTRRCCTPTQRLLPRRPSRPRGVELPARVLRAGGPHPTMTYSMNRLQRLREDEEYCVTLNRGRDLDEERVIARFDYTHPQYTFTSLAAQAELPALNGPNRTAFAGAWQGFGFHEDGLASGQRAAEAVARMTPHVLYTGTVMHARRTPAEHVFRYRVAYAGLDVDRLDELNRLRLVGYGRRRPVTCATPTTSTATGRWPTRSAPTCGSRGHEPPARPDPPRHRPARRGLRLQPGLVLVPGGRGRRRPSWSWPRSTTRSASAARTCSSPATPSPAPACAATSTRRSCTCRRSSGWTRRTASSCPSRASATTRGSTSSEDGGRAVHRDAHRPRASRSPTSRWRARWPGTRCSPGRVTGLIHWQALRLWLKGVPRVPEAAVRTGPGVGAMSVVARRPALRELPRPAAGPLAAVAERVLLQRPRPDHARPPRCRPAGRHGGCGSATRTRANGRRSRSSATTSSGGSRGAAGSGSARRMWPATSPPATWPALLGAAGAEHRGGARARSADDGHAAGVAAAAAQPAQHAAPRRAQRPLPLRPRQRSLRAVPRRRR